MELMAKLSEKVMIMDFKNIEDKDMLNKIKAAETSLEGGYRGADAVYDKLFSILGAILGFAGYTTIVFTLSPWVLLYLLINVAIIYTLNMQTKKFEYSLKEERAELYRKSDYVYKTMSDFSYGKDIRVYNLNRWLVDKFKGFINGEITLLKKINFKNFKVSAIDIFLLIIREGIIYAYLIYRVIVAKDMEIGSFVMYFATVAGFATWLQTLITDISFIKSQDMYIDDLRELMEIGENENLQKDYRNIPKDAPYEIEFRNVSFRYPHSERYIYKNLSLKIKAGQKLAIVGVNGAGKTTFIKLLCRLYDPTEGEILLNGVNIKEFNKEEYYKLFSAVFQDIKVMAFSVAENVALKEIDNMYLIDWLVLGSVMLLPSLKMEK